MGNCIKIQKNAWNQQCLTSNDYFQVGRHFWNMEIKLCVYFATFDFVISLLVKITERYAHFAKYPLLVLDTMLSMPW